MKKLLSIILVAALLYACGRKDEQQTTSDPGSAGSLTTSEYDPKRGQGKFEKVDVSTTLDVAMAKDGKLVYELKCASCHKLTEEKLVGPGWAGVSKKHAPEWLMNFITDPDPMIDLDPELQSQLEMCLVRMPNQNLSDDDARATLEFMRENDGIK